MRFFAESFRRFTFVHMATMDLDFIARRQPDLVINMIAERFLIAVPEDDGAPTAEEQAEQKRAAGRTRDAVPFWQLATRPSPETAERMRSALLAEGRIRDATIVSLLAHAGLKPPEIVALRWRPRARHAPRDRRPRRRPGRLERIPLLGRLSERHRTRREFDREVPLLAHLAEDLDRWRECCDGSTGGSEFVFPGTDGGHWKRGEWGSGGTPCTSRWRRLRGRRVLAARPPARGLEAADQCRRVAGGSGGCAGHHARAGAERLLRGLVLHESDAVAAWSRRRSSG